MQYPQCQHENRAGAKFCEVHDSHDIRRAGALSRGLRGRSEASHALVTKSPLSLTRTSRQARDKDEGRPNASLHAQRIPSPSQRPPCQLPERPAWSWTSLTRLPAPPAGTTPPPPPRPRCPPMPSPLHSSSAIEKPSHESSENQPSTSSGRTPLKGASFHLRADNSLKRPRQQGRPYHGTGISVSIPGVRNSKMSAKITLKTHRP